GGASLVLRDELIGHLVEIVADDPRLRADRENIVADALDQRALPTRCDGADDVPGVACDEAKLRGIGPQLLLDVRVRQWRGLVMLPPVGAESPPEHVRDPAVLELARLHLEQIVRERKETETSVAQLAQRRGNLGMRWHRGELVRQLRLVFVV